MSADRKNIVEQINAAFAENNLEKVLSFCTDDLVWTMVGDTTVKGKDAIRRWIGSMNPQPPQLMIQQIVAEGDVAIARGDMIMKDSTDGIAHTYSFCDVYRFAGDRVAELIAFVIRTDKATAQDEAHKEAGRTV
jgi:uncharacterized protein